jgi:hypothetical protein
MDPDSIVDLVQVNLKFADKVKSLLKEASNKNFDKINESIIEFDLKSEVSKIAETLKSAVESLENENQETLMISADTVELEGKKQELLKITTQKEVIELEPSFLSLTVLLFLKSNKDRMRLPLSIVGRTYFLYMLLIILQLAMLGCMFWSLIFHEDKEISFDFTPMKTVLLVQLPCAIGLHLVLFPEVYLGMQIMKLANNQHD